MKMPSLSLVAWEPTSNVCWVTLIMNPITTQVVHSQRGFSKKPLEMLFFLLPSLCFKFSNAKKISMQISKTLGLEDPIFSCRFKVVGMVLLIHYLVQHLVEPYLRVLWLEATLNERDVKAKMAKKEKEKSWISSSQ